MNLQQTTRIPEAEEKKARRKKKKGSSSPIGFGRGKWPEIILKGLCQPNSMLIPIIGRPYLALRRKT